MQCTTLVALWAGDQRRHFAQERPQSWQQLKGGVLVARIPEVGQPDVERVLSVFPWVGRISCCVDVFTDAVSVVVSAASVDVFCFATAVAAAAVNIVPGSRMIAVGWFW